VTKEEGRHQPSIACAQLEVACCSFPLFSFCIESIHFVRGKCYEEKRKINEKEKVDWKSTGAKWQLEELEKANGKIFLVHVLLF